jgi:threonine/homoserine/homoserine lactone efflux protein
MAADTLLPPATFAALVWFVFVNSVTPGPNNIMLATSGVNFGVARTLPQMAGIFSGVVMITIAIGLGLGSIFSEYPLVRDVLRVLGVAYILWLAWKIATAGSLGGGDLPHPMTYGGSILFQGLNVKLWMVGIATIALYVRPGHTLGDTLQVTAGYALVNLPCMFIWAGFGAGLRDFLKVPGRIRTFNRVMALALVASVLPLLRG